jgi:hypothetical protein
MATESKVDDVPQLELSAAEQAKKWVFALLVLVCFHDREFPSFQGRQ